MLARDESDTEKRKSQAASKPAHIDTGPLAAMATGQFQSLGPLNRSEGEFQGELHGARATHLVQRIQDAK